MASTQSLAVKEMWAVRAAARDAGTTVDDEAWSDLTAEPRGVDCVETEVAGLTAVWAIPKDNAPDRALLCIHGDGYVSGSIYTHRKLFAHLPKAVGARALIADYRQAPADVHPAQVDDTTARTAGCSTRDSPPSASRSPATPQEARCRSPPSYGPETTACRCPQQRC